LVFEYFVGNPLTDDSDPLQIANLTQNRGFVCSCLRFAIESTDVFLVQ
jgi:hypothetical protein